jgi:hypothetical protein
MQADEQITKLNMLMHRYAHRQAAELPASSRTVRGQEPEIEQQPEGGGGGGGGGGRQAAQGTSKQPEVGRQAASEHRQAA